jgi:hypothetical protein
LGLAKKDKQLDARKLCSFFAKSQKQIGVVYFSSTTYALLGCTAFFIWYNNSLLLAPIQRKKGIDDEPCVVLKNIAPGIASNWRYFTGQLEDLVEKPAFYAQFVAEAVAQQNADAVLVKNIFIDVSPKANENFIVSSCIKLLVVDGIAFQWALHPEHVAEAIDKEIIIFPCRLRVEVAANPTLLQHKAVRYI